MSSTLYESWLEGEQPFGESNEAGVATESWTETWTESWTEAPTSNWTSPFAETGLPGASFAEGFSGYESFAREHEHEFEQTFEGEGESTWASPFAAVTPSATAAGGQEYLVGETEWRSPFATTTSGELWTEISAAEGLKIPGTASDERFQNKPWNFKPKPGKGGAAESNDVSGRAAVLEVRVSDFDIDDYRLKEVHKAEITKMVQRIVAGVRSQTMQTPITVYAYGETSTTASVEHNLKLSEHRAFNTLNRFKFEFTKAGLSGDRVRYSMYGTSEEHADFVTGNNREAKQFRGAVVRIVAPLAGCPTCPTPPRDPVKPPQRTDSALCITVPRIHPRRTTGMPPDVIPLGSIIPGLRLPVAIVRHARADVKVEDRKQRRTHNYVYEGWGIEIALPSGRVQVDLRADLRATIEAVARASASLAGSLQLGALGLALRIDTSVFAKLIAQLTVHLRLHLDIGLGTPRRPELQACPVLASPPFEPSMLAGTAFLVVPGQGYGPATITFAGPRVRLPKRTVTVPSDKSTIKTLLLLGGELRPVGSSGASREFELEGSPYGVHGVHGVRGETELEWESLEEQLAAFA